VDDVVTSDIRLGRAVFLDFASVDLNNDLDRRSLHSVLPQLEYYPETSASQLADRLRDTEVVLTNSVAFDGSLLNSLPKLKFIGLTATGYNHIDVITAEQRGIAVTQLRDYCTQSVAQHALTGMLCLNQHIFGLNRGVRSGLWTSGQYGRIRELPGQTLGIVGYGVLGQGLARLASSLGMNVIVAARDKEPVASGFVPLSELLSRSDVVSLHVPLNQSTRHLIGAPELALMQQHALLINVSRGAVVDAHALADSLRCRRIGGAFIDVFEVEPPPPDHPLLAQDLDNIILSPHMAWGSYEARQRAIDELALNVAAYCRHESRLRVV
jgi:glycerate dehydrogenase